MKSAANVSTRTSFEGAAAWSEGNGLISLLFAAHITVGLCLAGAGWYYHDEQLDLVIARELERMRLSRRWRPAVRFWVAVMDFSINAVFWPFLVYRNVRAYVRAVERGRAHDVVHGQAGADSVHLTHSRGKDGKCRGCAEGRACENAQPLAVIAPDDNKESRL